jgi:spore maturation protein CgeB
MKVFLFTEYYDYYLDSFYSRNDLSHLTYEGHLETLLRDYFGTDGSYRNYFRKIGHDATIVIGNDRRLQTKWLREHGIKTDFPDNREVVLLQIQEFQPDVFFISDIFKYTGDFLRKVSDTTGNIFAWIACPYPDDLDFSHIKCILSSSEAFVENFRKRGLASEVLKAAFDPAIKRFLEDSKTIEVSFIGGLSKTTHSRRVAGLEHLVRKGIDMKIFGYGLAKPKSFLSFLRPSLEKNFCGDIWGIEMYRTLNRSKISLNFHIDVGRNMNENMRLYEATGCGTLLMTENTPDLKDKFKDGEEVVSYDSFDDLIDKITYYLRHDAEREEISRNGQRACLERHGYDKRIRDFEKILFRYCS